MNKEFSVLYTDCRNDLLSYLTHLFHCQDTAEDIAQEAFTIVMNTAKDIAIQQTRAFLF